MPVSEDYLDFVLEQLEGVGLVAAKKMFGGVGLYLDMVFFGLIADDILYFKVDDTNRPDYEIRGMRPFRPFGKKSYIMQYYEVPVEVLEDRENLKKWAIKALDVAERKSFLRNTRKSPARKKKKT